MGKLGLYLAVIEFFMRFGDLFCSLGARLVLRRFVPVQAHSGSQFFLVSARPRALVLEIRPVLRTFSL